MARKGKNVVDYFPHFVNHGKTIYVLQKKFGNDGYAVLFKTFELLGDTENHFYDCRNEAEWEFLLARMDVEPDKCKQILDTIAKMQVIDPFLWNKGVIYSDNFVKNLEVVYARRTNKLLSYEEILKCVQETEPTELMLAETPLNEDDVDINDVQTKFCGKDVNINAQSKVKYSKVKDSKVKESKVKESKGTRKKNFSVGPKKSRASPSKFDFIDKIIEQFVQAHSDYEVVAIGKERSAGGKLLRHYKKKFPDATSEETLTGLRKYFEACMKIDDDWMKRNMSLSLIVGKFNEINQLLKSNGRKTKKGGISQEFRDKLLEEIQSGFSDGATDEPTNSP